MMKLIKLLLFLVALLLILCVIGLFWIDDLARTGIEKGGSWALGVETTVESADVGLFSGTLALEELAVANPAGFGDEPFLMLAGGAVEVSAPSLFGDRVDIPELELSGLTLHLVHGTSGSNYGRILENLGRFEGEVGEPSRNEPADDPANGGGSETATESRDGGKKFVIDRLAMKDITVCVTPVVELGFTKTSLTIDEIVLTGVGRKDNGLLLAEIVSLLVQKLLSESARLEGMPSVVSGALQGGLGDLESLTRNGFDQIGKQLEGGAKKALEGLRNKLPIPGLGK